VTDGVLDVLENRAHEPPPISRSYSAT
jgi:hypothetical protein